MYGKLCEEIWDVVLLRKSINCVLGKYQGCARLQLTSSVISTHWCVQCNSQVLVGSKQLCFHIVYHCVPVSRPLNWLKHLSIYVFSPFLNREREREKVDMMMEGGAMYSDGNDEGGWFYEQDKMWVLPSFIHLWQNGCNIYQTYIHMLISGTRSFYLAPCVFICVHFMMAASCFLLSIWFRVTILLPLHPRLFHFTCDFRDTFLPRKTQIEASFDTYLVIKDGKKKRILGWVTWMGWLWYITTVWLWIHHTRRMGRNDDRGSKVQFTFCLFITNIHLLTTLIGQLFTDYPTNLLRTGGWP